MSNKAPTNGEVYAVFQKVDPLHLGALLPPDLTDLSNDCQVAWARFGFALHEIWPTAPATQQKGVAPEQWEYVVAEFECNQSLEGSYSARDQWAKTFQEDLDTRGKNGWELAWFDRLSKVVVFKRRWDWEKPPEQPIDSKGARYEKALREIMYSGNNVTDPRQAESVLCDVRRIAYEALSP